MPEPTPADGPRELIERAHDVRVRSLAAIARTIGCSRGLLTTVSRGYLPKPRIVRKLVKVLKITEDDLIETIDYGRKCAYERDRGAT